MVVELSVENLAIIERTQLSLEPGLTVLTGETGAGKSLLIDAIELVLGGRADTDLVRAGAAKATVHVAFDLSQRAALRELCLELGFDLEDGVLHVQREVAAEGRSQCRVGGRLTPVGQLRQLGTYLVDLHGQHDHQSLLDPARHLGYLDEWIGAPAQRLREDVAARHHEASEARRRLAALRGGIRDREHRLDLLRFQVNEIEAAAPRVGETEELEAQLQRLRHAEKLAGAAYAALEALADRENCAIDLMGVAAQTLGHGARYDSVLTDLASPIEEALVLVEEAVRRLRDYAEQLEADPATLDEVTARVDALRRLRRKYGEDEAAVLRHLEAAREELAQLEDADQSEAELMEEVAMREAALRVAAEALTALRRERAHAFADLVVAHLRDLAMERAVFEVAMRPKPAEADGADDVEFYFSANAGEPPRALARIASGGEISRVMLAIKAGLAGLSEVPTLIFDEVDAGMGGRTAAAVARKLAELGRHSQVLVISHLPQIASRAAHHFRIEKLETDGRVVTRVRPLDADERVEEIARMLAGDRITESALANAREMLAGSETESHPAPSA